MKITETEEFRNELAAKGRVNVHGIGVFTVKPTKSRTGRNPKTGESIQIPAGKRVAFKPAPALKDQIAA